MAEVMKWVFLAQVFVGTNFLIAMAQKKIPGRVFCKKTQITKWQTNSTECLECLNCRRGEGSTHPCGTVLKTPSERNKPLRCEKCEKGKTFSTSRSNEMCKDCKKCKPNHRVIKKCTRRSDTVCGSCVVNYYNETDEMGITTCERCSPCCGDGKDKREDECVRLKGLSSDQVCSRLDAERCGKQQKPNSRLRSNVRIKPATHMNSLPKTSSESRLAPSNLTSTSPASPPSTDVVYDGTVIPTIKAKDTQPPVVVNIHNKNQLNSSSGGTSTVQNVLAIVLPVACIIVLIAVIAGFAISRWSKSKKRRDATSRVTSRESNINKESCAVEMEPLHSGEGNGVPTPQNQRKSKKQLERKERSTKVSTYLHCPKTYNGEAYGTMYHTVNALEKDQFIEVVCSLGFPRLERYRVYRESVGGDFNAVLESLITKNPKLKLEDLAEVFEKKGYTSIASLCREEDLRAQGN